MTGMTLQIIKPVLDAGDIVAKRSLPLPDSMDASHVFKKMETLTKELLIDMEKYMQTPWPLIAQDASKVSYAHKIQKKECRIQWQKPARILFNQIRALAAGPEAYTLHQGKRLKILSARLSVEPPFFHKMCAGGGFVCKQRVFDSGHRGQGAGHFKAAAGGQKGYDHSRIFKRPPLKNRYHNALILYII